MKRIEGPSTVLKFRNKLVEVTGIATGRVIFMKVLKDEDKDKCPHCGKPIDTEDGFIEDSPLFQEEAEPVNTLKHD